MIATIGVGIAINSAMQDLFGAENLCFPVFNGLILVLIVLFLPQGVWDPVRLRQWFKRKGGQA